MACQFHFYQASIDKNDNEKSIKRSETYKNRLPLLEMILEKSDNIDDDKEMHTKTKELITLIAEMRRNDDQDINWVEIHNNIEHEFLEKEKTK